MRGLLPSHQGVKEMSFPRGPLTLIPTRPSLTASQASCLRSESSGCNPFKCSHPGKLTTPKPPPREPVPQPRKLRLGESVGLKTSEGRRGKQRFLILFPFDPQRHLPGPFLECGFREPAPPVPPPLGSEQRPPPSRRFLTPPRPACYLRRPRRQAPSSRQGSHGRRSGRRASLLPPGPPAGRR